LFLYIKNVFWEKINVFLFQLLSDGNQVQLPTLWIHFLTFGSLGFFIYMLAYYVESVSFAMHESPMCAIGTSFIYINMMYCNAIFIAQKHPWTRGRPYDHHYMQYTVAYISNALAAPFWMMMIIYTCKDKRLCVNGQLSCHDLATLMWVILCVLTAALAYDIRQHTYRIVVSIIFMVCVVLWVALYFAGEHWFFIAEYAVHFAFIALWDPVMVYD
jgi:hypothetical protein